MAEYFLFYDNKGGKETVPVEFKSQKAADKFINDFEYRGGIKNFNYDHYGKNKRNFIIWAGGNPDDKNDKTSKRIVKYSGMTLFKYMMSMFGVKI